MNAPDELHGRDVTNTAFYDWLLSDRPGREGRTPQPLRGQLPGRVGSRYFPVLGEQWRARTASLVIPPQAGERPS